MAERQLTEEGSGAKGFAKIEPSKSKRFDAQSADQIAETEGNEELYNTGKLSLG